MGMNSGLLPLTLCPSCFKDVNGTFPCPFCGYENTRMPENRHALPPGFELENHYVVGRTLAQGRFGITSLAYDTRLSRPVAIREYFPAGLAHRNPTTFLVTSATRDAQESFKSGRQKFLEEARSLARFRNHPNIVSVQDFFEANGTACLVMTCYEGIDFLRYLKVKGGKISFGEAMKLLLPIMKALDDVHGTGFIHGNVSPDSLFITKTGEVRLLNFGAAKSVLSTLAPKTVSLPVGKEGYCPPEQANNENMGPWTDVYGMAATFYRALTGEVPSEAPEKASEGGDFPPLSARGVRVSRGVDEVIRKGLALKWQDRYQNMPTFSEALTKGIPTPAAPPRTPKVNAPVLPANAERASTAASAQNKDTGGLNLFSSLKKLTSLFLISVLILWLAGRGIFLQQYFTRATRFYEQGKAFYNAKDYTSAFERFSEAAKAGNIEAQYYLGLMYWNGWGVPQDNAQSVSWYRKAAEDGNVPAQTGLGMMYENGWAISRDDVQAVYWYHKAAEAGDATAKAYLRHMSEKGRNVW